MGLLPNNLGTSLEKIFSNHASIGLTVLAGVAVWRLVQHFRWGRAPKSQSLQGKTIIVTGASSGVGRATALILAQRDARVILACRNLSNAEEAKRFIRKHTSRGELIVRKLDLSSFSSIHEFVREFKRGFFSLDALINNAGVYCCPQSTSEDGFEMHFAVNYLGHFLLTKLLIDELKTSAPSRVVIVSSAHYTKGTIDYDNLGMIDENQKYNGLKAYSDSKMAAMMFGSELNRQLTGTGVSVYMVSPGIVWTNLGRHVQMSNWKKLLMLPLVLLLVKTPAEGAQSIVYCASEHPGKLHSGGYYRNCREARIDLKVANENGCKRLWELSEMLVKSR